jgi:hypothetical protein
MNDGIVSNLFRYVRGKFPDLHKMVWSFLKISPYIENFAWILCNVLPYTGKILQAINRFHAYIEPDLIVVIKRQKYKIPFFSESAPHCKKSHVGMRQTPMLTTVAQNQTTWEWEFSNPHVVWFAPLLSTSEFREALFTVHGPGSPTVIFFPIWFNT